MFKNITTLLYLYFQIKRALTLKKSKKKYFTGSLGSENFMELENLTWHFIGT